MSGCGLWRDCSKARRWRCCAGNSNISSKTGYKLFARYKNCGVEGLSDRSRRPYRHANRLPFQVETLIVQLKKEHASWGAPKIREKLRRLHSEIQLPAVSGWARRMRSCMNES